MPALDEIVAWCDRRTRRAAFVDYPGAVNGLQVANEGRVTRIGAAVDAGAAPFAKAVAAGVDFLIVHHGLFWDPPRPITGPVYRKLATLLHGGVDLVEALEIVANVVGNELWRNAVYETIREVNDGNSLVTAFQRHKFIPTMVNQMLSVGEGTGKTQDILQRIAAFYAREVDNVVGNLTKLIEPLVLVILGLAVGVMVSAIMIPLYSLSSGA